MLRLAPDPASAGTQLTNHFAVTNRLTAWAHGIANTVLYPISPQPDWFSTLQTAIQQGQTVASQWIQQDGPQVTAGFPQTFIDYANEFGPASAQLRQLVAASLVNAGHTPTASQRQMMQQILADLIRLATQQATTVTAQQQIISAFYGQVKASHDAIAAGITAANATIGTDQQAIDAIREKIGTIQQQLGIVTQSAADAEKSAAQSAITLFLTVFVYVISVAATDGATLPLFGIAGGLIGTSFSTTMANLNDQKILDAMQDIANLQGQLTADNQQIAALEGMLNTLRMLQDEEESVEAVSDALMLWNDVVNQLQWTNEVLNQPTLDVSLVTAFTNLDDAASVWNTISQQATNVLNSSVSVTQPVQLKVPVATLVTA